MTKNEQREKLYNDVKKSCDALGYEIASDKSEFINNSSRIKYICPKHGIQEKSATSLKQGKKCPLCANETKWKNAVLSRSNNETTKKRYYNQAVNICNQKDYLLLSEIEEFTGYKSYIRYKCKRHGEKSMRFGNLINGKICPDCNNEVISNRYSLNKFDVIYRVESYGGRLLNPDEYINNSKNNLLIECPRCHRNIITTSLAHFTQHGGKVCDECYKKESNGERIIRCWLEDNGVKYESQKWFDDCRDIKPLPFDFYLPESNTIIEFDGKQHFEDNHYFNHADSRFETVLSYIKYHDEIKNNYCEKSGINLIRIPYYQINKIDEILSGLLNV